MRRRLGIGQGTVGKVQSLVDSPEHPQHDGIKSFYCGAGILAEPVGEIAMLRLVVELNTLLKMLMGAGKVAEIPTGVAGTAVCDHCLGAIRPRRGLAQKKLGHFAHRCGFAPRLVPDPETVIGGKPLRGVLQAVRQFAGTRKGRARFRRLISLGPDQRIAEARL